MHSFIKMNNYGIFHNYTDDSTLIPVSTLMNSTATKPVFYSNFNCHGFESTLSHCTSLSYPHFQCGYQYYSGNYVHRNVRIRCHDGNISFIYFMDLIIIIIINF